MSYPLTFDEFVAKEDEHVESILRRYTRDTEMLKDLKQEVYKRFLDKQLVERYDPKLSKWTTHLYQCVRSVAINYLKRYSRTPLTRAGAITEQTGEDKERFTTVLMREAEAERWIEERAAKQLVDNLMDELDKSENNPWRGRHARKVYAHSIGVRTMSLKLVAELLYSGHSTKDIAALLNVSHSSVGVWVAKIRRILQSIMYLTNPSNSEEGTKAWTGITDQGPLKSEQN